MWLCAQQGQHLFDITDQKDEEELTDRFGGREIVVKASCRGRLQNRNSDFVGSSARLNLALIKLRAVQIINFRNSEFHNPTILNTSNLTMSGHVDGEPSR